MLRIRRYESQDYETVKALHFAGFDQHDMAHDIQEHSPYDVDIDNIEDVYLKGGDFLVGILDGEIIAMGAIRKLSKIRAEIKRIRVRKDHQRKGYGQIILKKLIEISGKKGFREICIDALVENTAARHMFEKLQFTETHRGELGPFNVIYYIKKLDGIDNTKGR